MNGLLEKTYSTALFQLCIEENSLDKSFEEMMFISNTFSSNEELLKIVSLPTVKANEKQKVIASVFDGRISKTVLNFLYILIEKNRISYINKIAEQFKDMYNNSCGILEVTVITAKPMNNALKDKLIKKLEAVTSKKINLIEMVDSKILGGIVLKYNNSLLDSSVKTKLDNMRAQIDSIIA